MIISINHSQSILSIMTNRYESFSIIFNQLMITHDHHESFLFSMLVCFLINVFQWPFISSHYLVQCLATNCHISYLCFCFILSYLLSIIFMLKFTTGYRLCCECFPLPLIDHDECVDGSHSCESYEECMNRKSSYECHCRMGYIRIKGFCHSQFPS